MKRLEEHLAEQAGTLYLGSTESSIEDLWKAASQTAQAQINADPRETDFHEAWGEQPVAIGFLADWHIGSRWVDYDFLMQFCDEMRAWREANPGALKIAFLGDGTDGYLPNMDRHSNGMFEEVVTSVDQQDALFMYAMDRLGGVDWITLGCHWAWRLNHGNDPLLTIAPAIGARHAGFGFYLRTQVGDHEYRIIARHKATGVTRTNPTGGNRRLFDEYEAPGHDDGRKADIVARAHFHTNMSFRERRTGLDTIWLAPGGAKGSDNYARSIGVRNCQGAGEFGFPIVILWPDRKRMVNFHGTDWREALEFLKQARARSV